MCVLSARRVGGNFEQSNTHKRLRHMRYVTLILSFLKGSSTDAVGTSKNLLREVVVAVLTATLTYLMVHLLAPAEPTQLDGFRDVLKSSLANQREADSLRTFVKLRAKDETIDSLKTVIQNHAEKDSMRANAGLSTLDAMRKINGAVKADAEARRSWGFNR